MSTKKSRTNHATRLMVALIVGIALILLFLVRNPLTGTSIAEILYQGTQADKELMVLHKQFKRGEFPGTEEDLREQLLAIAESNEGTRAELTANLFIATAWPDQPAAKPAMESLLKAAESADLEDVARTLRENRPRKGERWHALAQLLIKRVQAEPNHPKAARLLCDAAVVLNPADSASHPPEELSQIGQLILDRYLTSPELSNFCEVASNLGHPNDWIGTFEPHMKRILETNTDRFVQSSAHYAMAAMVRAAGPERHEEAINLYQGYLDQFDGKTPYPAQSIEQLYRQQSEEVLKILANHATSMAAPPTAGLDLHGNPIDLEDYRGRVVLISFWATWCKPCIDSIPHEKALVNQFDAADFAIFGINADTKIQKAKQLEQIHEIPWRSLQTRGSDKPTAFNWIVEGYPTLYLLDRDLKIVKSWLGFPSQTELTTLIKRLTE